MLRQSTGAHGLLQRQTRVFAVFTIDRQWPTQIVQIHCVSKVVRLYDTLFYRLQLYYIGHGEAHNTAS